MSDGSLYDNPQPGPSGLGRSPSTAATTTATAPTATTTVTPATTVTTLLKDEDLPFVTEVYSIDEALWAIEENFELDGVQYFGGKFCHDEFLGETMDQESSTPIVTPTVPPPVSPVSVETLDQGPGTLVIEPTQPQPEPPAPTETRNQGSNTPVIVPIVVHPAPRAESITLYSVTGESSCLSSTSHLPLQEAASIMIREGVMINEMEKGQPNVTRGHDTLPLSYAYIFLRLPISLARIQWLFRYLYNREARIQIWWILKCGGEWSITIPGCEITLQGLVYLPSRMKVLIRYYPIPEYTFQIDVPNHKQFLGVQCSVASIINIQEQATTLFTTTDPIDPLRTPTLRLKDISQLLEQKQLFSPQ